MLWPSQQNMCYDMFFLSTSFTGFEPDLKSGGSKWGWLRFPKGFAPSRNCSVDFWSSDLISPNLSSHCQYQSICGNTSSVITPKFRAKILSKTLFCESKLDAPWHQIVASQSMMYKSMVYRIRWCMHVCMLYACMHMFWYVWMLKFSQILNCDLKMSLGTETPQLIDRFDRILCSRNICSVFLKIFDFWIFF